MVSPSIKIELSEAVSLGDLRQHLIFVSFLPWEVVVEKFCNVACTQERVTFLIRISRLFTEELR